METKYVVKGENNLYLTYTGYTIENGEKEIGFGIGERVLYDSLEQACVDGMQATRHWFSVETVYRKVN